MNKFRWTCPYCGIVNSIKTDERQSLLYCDVEIGGCDKISVVVFSVETFTTVLKVEGEMESYQTDLKEAMKEEAE